MDEGCRIIAERWLVNDWSFPDLAWARLRVFDDGSAEVRFDPAAPAHAFRYRQDAEVFLADEDFHQPEVIAAVYRDEGNELLALRPPSWSGGSGAKAYST